MSNANEIQTDALTREGKLESKSKNLENQSKNMESESELERLCADARRAAYMIGWRDRLIENLKAQIQGHEELATLMEALLAFALFRIAKADPEQGRFVTRVPKAELRELLTHWQSKVSDTDDAYVVSFAGKRCEEHAKACPEE